MMLSFATVGALGDAGSFSGSSDYGGSSDSGSSWSSSDDDYSSSGGGRDATPGEMLFGVLIFAVFILFAARKGKKSTRPAAPSVSVSPIAGYKELNPGFKETELCAKISNVYVQMQHAWTAKDFEPMRPYFTDTMYAQFDRQLGEMRKNGQTNYVDRIAVLGVTLKGWYQQEGNDCMVAAVRTRIVDYTLDDKTGKLISGHRDREKFMEYEYTLIRTTGAVSYDQEKDAEAYNCPNCGAPLDVNHSAKCPYCDSIVTAKDHDWVISSIKGISQRTAQ